MGRGGAPAGPRPSGLWPVLLLPEMRPRQVRPHPRPPAGEVRGGQGRAGRGEEVGPGLGFSGLGRAVPTIQPRRPLRWPGEAVDLAHWLLSPPAWGQEKMSEQKINAPGRPLGMGQDLAGVGKGKVEEIRDSAHISTCFPGRAGTIWHRRRSLITAWLAWAGGAGWSLRVATAA